jgi:saccharopine dehydrogenase-like NADP-dependent oxidoreductase
VTIADVREGALGVALKRCGGRARTVKADLSNPVTIEGLSRDADVVVGALSSRLGRMALGAVAASGTPYCDISFMPEDALDDDAMVKARGGLAVVDMGVAPGMSNLLAGVIAEELSPCEMLEIYVGGLPMERRWPWSYKAGFSPADVIEEYTRPARLVEHGRIVVRPALSEPELMDFAGVGTLEAFNTDGLRSLAYTLKVPFMKEKTLRYPGHIELMRVLREMGLFSKEPVEVQGRSVVPLEVTSALLFPKWTYEPGERDLTVMRVSGTGMKDGVRTRVTWDVLDHLDQATGFTSMARTTAFPATSVARMLLDGTISGSGVIVPEMLAGRQDVLARLLRELSQRGIEYRRAQERVGSA